MASHAATLHRFPDPVATPTEADLTLSANAETVLARRYLARDAAGNIIERPSDLFHRVARVVASAETAHGGDAAATERAFYDLMARRAFLPNSPALMNAGQPLGQLAACFVVPVDDSMPAIFDAVKWAAMIQMSGGGTGFAFSRLRPAGDRVATTGGAASGPVPFMDIFNSATDTIVQGGRRRGANMGILRVDHPDIVEFIRAKLDPRRLTNFNLSVAITDDFMRAVATDADYALVNPRTGLATRHLHARTVFRLISNLAWQSGEPGVVFIDRINAAHPARHIGPIESTNPCVTGDTRVWTPEGLIPIRELVGQSPVVATQGDTGFAFQRATQVACTGVKPVLRLVTHEGYQLRLTAEHLVSTERGDVPAGELEPGDRIILADAPASSSPQRDSADARLGELIGWLVGDGHFTQHSSDTPTAVLSFYGADKQDAGPRLLDAARTLIDDDRLALCAVPQRDLATIRSARLRAALARRGVDPRAKTEVPELLFRASPDLVAGYLRGLFSADGSVQGSHAHGASVRLASNQLELLRGVQLLLLRLGITSTVYPERRAARMARMPDGRGDLREYACAAQHELVIARSGLRSYHERIGFLLAGKQERLAGLLAAYRRGPYEARRCATVRELVPDGEEEVFDLTEPVTSHFFADGMLVHNCGEQPLLPFESCVLGSLNLAAFVDDGALDEPALTDATHLAVRFLDDVIDASRYPLPQIEAITRANRKLGLGVMGFADLLIALGIAYDSDQAIVTADRVMGLIERESVAASRALARTRGAFPNYRGSSWDTPGAAPMRNATTTTVAPTGTISIIAGCSSGIEPLFAVSYVRTVLEGTRLTEVHPGFRALAEARGFASPDLLSRLADRGRVRGLPTSDVPADVQALFATAHDVSPEQHVRMQAAFQRHVHSSVSKTINLPAASTPDDVARIYDLAYAQGCKGVTVYRDGSREAQVLSFGGDAASATETTTSEALPPEGGCPECGHALFHGRGCLVCESCGWSRCG